MKAYALHTDGIVLSEDGSVSVILADRFDLGIHTDFHYSIASLKKQQIQGVSIAFSHTGHGDRAHAG